MREYVVYYEERDRIIYRNITADTWEIGPSGALNFMNKSGTVDCFAKGYWKRVKDA